MIIRPLGAELFHTDRRTYRHDEANSRFLQFCESAKKGKNALFRLMIISPNKLKI